MTESRELPATLVVPALEEIVARLDAREVLAPDGGPFRTLRTVEDDQPAGLVRVWESEVVPRIVYTNLDVPSKSLVSHMFYALTAAESAVPHFTLDAAATRGIVAFHADLIHRVDLPSHLEYMDAVFGPLDATHQDVDKDETFQPAVVPARGRAMMSPWMLANRLSESTFQAAIAPSRVYLEHWFALLDEGLPEHVLATCFDTDLAARDEALRRNLFGRDIDPAWDMVSKLVGADPINAMRAAMRGLELTPAPN